jgi:integrase/recombinase XerD
MDSRSGCRRGRFIVVRGPLAPFAAGFRRDAAARGYALDTVTEHVHLLADLSDWLTERALPASALTPGAVTDFLARRRSDARRTGLTVRGLAPVIDYLRPVETVPPLLDEVTVATLQDAVLAGYRRYLAEERALSESTVKHYSRCARRFLSSLADPGVRQICRWGCQAALACWQRRVVMPVAPRVDQCMPESFNRWPITALQPASTTPEPMNMPRAR